MAYNIVQANATEYLQARQIEAPVDLTFLDPPFNQDKDYAFHNDRLPEEKYWQWMKTICGEIYAITAEGGAIYFMQREKNTEQVLSCLREAGWNFQNLIIWKKMTSAVPSPNKFGKHYQVIAYAIKGEKPRIFNKLRISPPLLPNYKYERPNGMFVTDVWDDIRELTSGYFAGDEALRNPNGERLHKQQAPIALLLRIILSSSQVGDTVLDPFAGTGTTLVVAEQLQRYSVGIEIDPQNVKSIQDRLGDVRKADRLEKYYEEYIFTEALEEIWGAKLSEKKQADVFDLPLFRSSDPK